MKYRLAAAGLLLGLFILLIVYAMSREPHKFSEAECLSCHLKDSSGKISKQLSSSVTELCVRCHKDIFTEGYIHPVDVIPRHVSIPADMPLSQTGQITCSTCHEIHSSYFTPYGTKSYFLRRNERGQSFCVICHAAGKGHEEHLGEAHFNSRYVVTDSAQEIDPMSKNCISCHDGTYSSSVTVKVGKWFHQEELIPYDMRSHPIGVDYERARLDRRSRTDLRPMNMVDPRIKFFDGRVGCGSCHDPYSDLGKKLVMSDKGSRLCFACHRVEGG
jgi:predicted CXXCH cytochrome family protein